MQAAEGFVHTQGIGSRETIGRPACSSYIHEEDANSDSWIDSKERHKAMMQGQSVVDLNWGEPAFHFNF
jgi:antibiotic biosynthesis monooxygenase (ABM) superfamily enzyme